jgi:hypothetical protein
VIDPSSPLASSVIIPVVDNMSFLLLQYNELGPALEVSQNFFSLSFIFFEVSKLEQIQSLLLEKENFPETFLF